MRVLLSPSLDESLYHATFTLFDIAVTLTIMNLAHHGVTFSLVTILLNTLPLPLFARSLTLYSIAMITLLAGPANVLFDIAITVRAVKSPHHLAHATSIEIIS